ncbi:MAG: hypothetical protein JNL02_07020 [Saprospiraceae bacterium]|nr:hypothetical protein [Saprospiraceae bacterium]
MKNFGGVLFVLLLAFVACEQRQAPARVESAVIAQPQPLPEPGPRAYVEIDTRFFPRSERAFWQWWFNGCLVDTAQLRYTVPVREGLDTVIVLNRHSRRDSLFLICDLRADSTYTLSYNDCCNDFYLRSNTPDKRESGQMVEFQLKNSRDKKRWLGCLGNTAVLLRPGEQNTLTYDRTHSPMHSNRFNLWVTPYVPADLDTTLYTLVDSRDGRELGGFSPPGGYRAAGINFTFLHADRVRLVYDVKKRVYTLEKMKPEGK